jgi:type IV fimbrial biogenesis protein FimT
MTRALRVPQIMRHSAGFTLIELLVSLAISVILLAVGVPSFQEFVKSNRLSTEVNALIAGFHYAKSEAIKRGVRVSLCKSGDLTTCSKADGWEQGWMVFIDPDNSNSPETILHTSMASGGTITIRGNSHVSERISFISSGMSRNNNGQIIFCDDRIRAFSTDRAKARVIVISTTGRIRTISSDDRSVSVNSCTPG